MNAFILTASFIVMVAILRFLVKKKMAKIEKEYQEGQNYCKDLLATLWMDEVADIINKQEPGNFRAGMLAVYLDWNRE